MQCLCKRMRISDGFDYADVDWTASSVMHKSQHVPLKYALGIMRKNGINETLIPFSSSQGTALLVWELEAKLSWISLERSISWA